MTSRDGSVTPSSRYGDVIESIISTDSEELEEKRKTSVSQVKRMFRERRQRSSPGRQATRSQTPERRQNPSSPIRQYNDMRNINRPPTPDKRRVSPRNNTSSSSRMDSVHLKTKGISGRPLSTSPTKRRAPGVESQSFIETLTTRVAKQVSKELNNMSVEEASSQIMSEREEERSFRLKAPSATTRTRSGELGGYTVQNKNHRATTNDRGEDFATPENFQQESRNGIDPQRQEIRETMVKTTKLSKSDQESLFPQSVSNIESLSAKITPKVGNDVSNSPEEVKKMKDLIQAQREQIEFFEKALKNRSTKIEQLTLELEFSKKNETELQLELEIHDLKYSMYDDYRRMMDQKRLNRTSDNEGDERDRNLKGSPLSKSCHEFSKLDHLEKLYEKSRLVSESRFSILQEEYERIKKTTNCSDEEIPTDTTNSSPCSNKITGEFVKVRWDLLKNRVQILESENLNYSLEIKRKAAELDKAKLEQIDSISRKKEILVHNHNLEKQTLENRISALETEIGFTSGRIDDKTRTRRYCALEKSLNDYVAEIMGLEDQLKAKEKIISELKERELATKTGIQTKKNLDHTFSASSVKWYEKPNDERKKPNARKETQVDQLYGLDYAPEPSLTCCVSNDVLELKSRLSKGIKGKMVESRKNMNVQGNGQSSSSARIAMLRKRLDALAHDHASIGTI